MADIDSSTLTTTLNVSSGTLNVTGGAGVTATARVSLTFTGTAAEINTALAGLAYTGNPDFNGADTLTSRPASDRHRHRYDRDHLNR